MTPQVATRNTVNDYAERLLAASRTPEQYQVPAKVYFHHYNYAKFHFDFGGSQVKSVSFANYRYITDDKREQDQLDLVADIPGTYIYTMPDSDVERAIQQELAQELLLSVNQTSQAHAQVNNIQFDPNAPIIPVQVNQATSTPVSIMPVTPQPNRTQQLQQGSAVVGMANSFSGSQATEGGAPAFTNSADQTRAPSAADEAAARIAAMTSAVTTLGQPQK